MSQPDDRHLTWSVRPQAPFGAIVEGVDVAGRPTPAAVASLKAVLHQHNLLVLRGQDSPDPEQFSAFMAGLGTLARPAEQGKGRAESRAATSTAAARPELVLLTNRITEQGRAVGYTGAGHRGLGWHSDYSWADSVSVIAALEALTVPSWGGETAFANMYAAYDALDPDERDLCRRLHAVHSLPENIDYRVDGESEQPGSTRVRPLVATNPYTGRRALYLSSLYTTRIVGLPEDEAADLRDRLVEHSTAPRFVLTHSWQAGDLVLWDEIGLVHRRLPFDESEPRMMRQIALVVDDPAAPWADAPPAPPVQLVTGVGA